MPFSDYQNEIYLQGLSGIAPSLPMAFAEWEAKAEAALPPSVWSYVAGGAGRAHPTGQRERFPPMGNRPAKVRRRDGA
jgi:hypothetical protein